MTPPEPVPVSPARAVREQMTVFGQREATPLYADQFEIYHGKAFLDGALKAADRLYSVEGSRSHPPRAARVEAVLVGYKSGSPCGNLAPAIRGYSPQAR